MAITEVRRFLWLVTRFAHISGRILVHTSLQILKVSLGNSTFQLPPQNCYRINVWKLARPLHDLIMCCFFGALAVCFWIVTLEDISSVFWQRKGGSRPRFYSTWSRPSALLTAVKSSCILSRETAPKHNVYKSVLECRDGVHGVHFSPSRRVELMPNMSILVSI